MKKEQISQQLGKLSFPKAVIGNLQCLSFSQAYGNSGGVGDPRTLRAATSSGMWTVLNNTPSSVLTGHLPPHGEAAHFNAPSTWRERAECASTGVRGLMPCGFTLIELLVVVLIIGILAAVALPQYNKAVKKAQGREVLVAINALDKALAAYALAHDNACGSNFEGDHCNQGEGLDIEIPRTKHFVHTGTGTADSVTGTRPVATFEAIAADATLTATYNLAGKRTQTECLGQNCAAYFDCNSITTVQTCYDIPWDGEGYCPSPTRPNSLCEVNI